jgi:hypothetical protein
VHADEDGDEHGQGKGAVKDSEQTTQPPGCPPQKCEADGVAEGEDLPHDKMEDESGGTGSVRVRGDHGAQDQGKV